MAKGYFSFKARIFHFFQVCKKNSQLSLSVFLILLAILLAFLSRSSIGGSSFSEFVSGLMMGLSVGILLMGILLAFIFFHHRH